MKQAFSQFGNRVNLQIVPRRTYKLQTDAASAVITKDELKRNAKIDLSETAEDALLDSMIKSATTMAEQFMNRDLINKTYIAYMDYFPLEQYCVDQLGIEIEKSKLQSITSIQYSVNGVFQTFDSSNYYSTDEQYYSKIYLKPDKAWPDDADDIRQAVKITFVAGYGASSTAVPEDIRLALMQHCTFMNQSRGDSGDGGFSEVLPKQVERVYERYKIWTLDS